MDNIISGLVSLAVVSTGRIRILINPSHYLTYMKYDVCFTGY
jgi:hypothetical protein